MAGTFDVKNIKSPDLIQSSTREDNYLKQTYADDTSAVPSNLSKLPALVIKGQGNDVQPLDKNNKILSKRQTVAYALSPKLIKNLRLEDRI